MLAKLEDTLITNPIEEPVNIHCFDPWLILRAKSNQEAKAKKSLMQEGFEVYYGERREIITVTIPAKKISSKTRHRRRSEYREIERIRPVYPGYLFARRLFGGFDLYRAYELDGVLGLCCVGEHPATLPDYKIELLRLAEMRGYFRHQGRIVEIDQRRHSVQQADIRAAERQRAKEEAAKEKGTKPPKPTPREIGRLDESDRTILFVEEFGRITRIITSRTALGPKSGVPPQVRSLKEVL